MNEKACCVKNRKELAWQEQVAGAQTEMKNEAQDTSKQDLEVLNIQVQHKWNVQKPYLAISKNIHFIPRPN